jgi:hypothetical protein
MIALTIPQLAISRLAWADECGDAVTDYNTVLDQLNDATQKFSSCIANSLGTDGCSKEFGRLRMVYSQYQSAVTLYRTQCVGEKGK